MNRISAPEQAAWDRLAIRVRDDDQGRELRKRWRMACLEEDKAGQAMLVYLLDMREDRIRRSRAAARHPLARGGTR